MNKAINKVITFFSLTLPPVFILLSAWCLFLVVNIFAQGRFKHIPDEGQNLVIAMLAVSAVNTVLSILSLYLSLWKKAFQPAFVIIVLVQAIYGFFIIYCHQCSWPR